jgi:hypothetical protein
LKWEVCFAARCNNLGALDLGAEEGIPVPPRDRETIMDIARKAS